jgi:raffinose/stachyose/melibiose transport system substrate-binding protein
MKRKVVSILLVASMAVGLLAGCGTSGKGTTGTTGTEGQGTSEESGEVLEFYHGYYHEESEWAAAQVMRDIYEEFAEAHADGTVTFKAIAVENRDDIVSAQVAGGNFPDMVDMGSTIPQSAISQGLVLDLKPFIDENNLQDAVGLNYTQGDVDGAIYTIHDQIETRGLWYNSSVLEAAGVSIADLSTWNGFADAMVKVRALGGDTYGYAAGQGSLKMINAYLAQTAEGRTLIESDFTEDTIYSDTFAEAFKTIAALDQANGSDHTTADVGNLMADFNENGMAAVLSNGVWNASGISDALADVIYPTLFPGKVSIASAGSGLTVSSGMSEEKTQLALEFIEYMVSPEVQARIFTEVQANPCNTTLDLNQLAEESGDPIVIKLAEACSLANSAEIIVKDMQYVWGGDVANAIINALMECATSGTDIDARFEQLQSELIALIG